MYKSEGMYFINDIQKETYEQTDYEMEFIKDFKPPNRHVEVHLFHKITRKHFQFNTENINMLEINHIKIIISNFENID